MNIVFYRMPFSSAVPVASVLNELQVPHERITLDRQAGDTRKPAFLALNPNGLVPTLVIDGQPLFEACAIMQWLGDRFGVEKQLWPAQDDPARLDALSWSTWAYVTLGGALQRANFAGGEQAPKELHHAPLAAHAKAQVQQYFGLLEARLAKQPFLLGKNFSVLDIIVGSVVVWATFSGHPVSDHPALSAWMEKVRARPSIREEWQ